MTRRVVRKRVVRAAQIALVLIVSMASVDLGWAAGDPRYTRTEVTVALPDVEVINQNGRVVSLQEIMAADKPVFVEFIFATCTTICPLLSAGYASMQRKLGEDRDRVRLISITIDPENDGPEELTGYLKRYGARSGWDFYTGTREDINTVMRSFDAYVPDKMSHQPLVFIRSSVDGSWVRLYGFASSADLMAEFQRAEGEEDSVGVEE